ncbi:MAG: hypothetical protein ABI612_19940 [Betaproteobacteria bacterium]
MKDLALFAGGDKDAWAVLHGGEVKSINLLSVLKITWPDSRELSWASLLKRVLDIDIEHCPCFEGRLEIIAAIINPDDYEDPHPRRLAAARAAQITGAASPSVPSGLIGDSCCLPSGLAAGILKVVLFDERPSCSLRHDTPYERRSPVA